ncbi:hypothetical protein [Fluviispira sanaruensis]|uniref:RDD domain-containing protein n=1 Tax=Fluviispira sanaruensis TaxID=2493639 RepID=A0A4P2VJT9_FLUSA|nr:hypothetical protein [Fluviispira sanaruensis]BBH53503.1 hypothetical protein JCM31447_19470 [Fluviispira sanaruensis]
MSFSEESQKRSIQPLHTGFGFFAESINDKSQNLPLKEIELTSQNDIYLNSDIEKSPIILNENYYMENINNSPTNFVKDESVYKEKQINAFYNDQKEGENDTNYFVHPFFAFLAWTVDALVGFCFLIISLCINTVFIPKGFFDVTSSLVKYLSVVTVDLGVLYTFLFSLQVWFFMAILVFLFQYSILGFEGATLGRWLFGISIQNSKDKNAKVSERTKFCAALSESMLLGSILSFLFIILLPSRVPIFFWMRYSSKNL